MSDRLLQIFSSKLPRRGTCQNLKRSFCLLWRSCASGLCPSWACPSPSTMISCSLIRPSDRRLNRTFRTFSEASVSAPGFDSAVAAASEVIRALASFADRPSPCKPMQAHASPCKPMARKRLGRGHQPASSFNQFFLFLSACAEAARREWAL